MKIATLFPYCIHLVVRPERTHSGSDSVVRSELKPHTKTTVFLSALLLFGILGCAADQVILEDSLATTVDPTAAHAVSDDLTETAVNLAQITYMDNFALLSIGPSQFKLEVASSPVELQTGLMGRSKLAPNEGMLFSFGHEEKWGLWMKQTLVPLDAIWLNSSGTVVHITTMPVQTEVPDSQLVVYTPPIPSLYAIELTAGSALRAGIELGMKIDIAHVGWP